MTAVVHCALPVRIEIERGIVLFRIGQCPEVIAMFVNDETLT